MGLVAGFIAMGALVACPTEDDGNDGPTATVSVEATGAMASEQGSDGEFTITLTGDTTTAAVVVPITLAITGDTAAHSDYALTATSPASLNGNDGSRSVTIPTGESSATLTLSAEDDADETNETLTLTLGEGISGGGITVSRTTTVSDQSASVTIVDNDRAATEATIAATIAAASEDTPTDGEFTISLNGQPPTGGVRVHFTISGTATAGEDWTAPTDNWVVIDQQPSRSATIAVDVTDDSRVEGDETVIVTLDRVTDTSDVPIGSITASNPSNTDATVTIADDDGTVEASLTLDTTSITEGDGGTTSQMLTITPALTFSETGSTLGSAVTIDNLAIGSASTATVGASEDYTITTALTPTTLTIAAGSGAATSLTGATITLAIVGDTVVEPDETIRFTADAAGGLLANAGTIGVDFTIDNDDFVVSMAATTVSVTEGGMAAVTVRIGEAQSEDVVVVVTTSDGTARSTDLTGETIPDYGTPDYTALTGNAAQVTIAAGMTEETVMIATVEGARMDSDGDPVPIVELAEETFTVTIDSVMSGPAALHDDSAMLETTVTITDDDEAYFALLTRNFYFPDNNSFDSSTQENANSRMRLIVARERNVDETSALNVGLAVAVPLRVSFAGIRFLLITNTAETGEDYPDSPIDFVFPAGAPAAGVQDVLELEERVDYPVIDDDVVEVTEGVRATLAFRDLTRTGLDSGNLNIGVRNTDQHEDYGIFPGASPDTATLSVGDATVVEGETAMVPVTLSAPVEGRPVVTLTPSAESDDSATADTDFPTAAVMLTLPNRVPRTTISGNSINQCPAATPCMVPVPTTQETVGSEGSETFTVTLTFSGGPSGVSLGTATATVTITDDD